MNIRVKNFLRGMASALEIFPNKIKNVPVPSPSATTRDKSIKKHFNTVEKRIRDITLHEAQVIKK